MTRRAAIYVRISLDVTGERLGHSSPRRWPARSARRKHSRLQPSFHRARLATRRVAMPPTNCNG